MLLLLIKKKIKETIKARRKNNSMKKNNLYILFLLFLICILFNSCSSKKEKYIQIIESENISLLIKKLKKDKKINKFDSNNELLELAIKKDNLEIIKILIEFGADVNTKLTNSQYPLEYAVEKKMLN